MWLKSPILIGWRCAKQPNQPSSQSKSFCLCWTHLFCKREAGSLPSIWPFRWFHNRRPPRPRALSTGLWPGSRGVASWRRAAARWTSFCNRALLSCWQSFSNWPQWRCLCCCTTREQTASPLMLLRVPVREGGNNYFLPINMRLTAESTVWLLLTDSLVYSNGL